MRNGKPAASRVLSSHLHNADVQKLISAGDEKITGLQHNIHLLLMS